MRAVSYYIFFVVFAFLLTGLGGCSKADQCKGGLRHDCALPDNSVYERPPPTPDTPKPGQSPGGTIDTGVDSDHYKPLLNVQLWQEVDQEIKFDCHNEYKTKSEVIVRSNAELIRLVPKSAVTVHRSVILNTRNRDTVTRVGDTPEKLKQVFVGLTRGILATQTAASGNGQLVVLPGDNILNYRYDSCVTPDETAPQGCREWHLEEENTVKVTVQVKTEVRTLCKRKQKCPLGIPSPKFGECLNERPASVPASAPADIY